VRAREVQRVYREGKPLRGKRVVLWLAPGAGGYAVIAARRVGGAVQRNRARRVLREAWRQVSPRAVVEASDAVLVAREAILGATTHDLVAEMDQLLGAARTA
jgi:ribonuclease P protein component